WREDGHRPCPYRHRHLARRPDPAQVGHLPVGDERAGRPRRHLDGDPQLQGVHELSPARRCQRYGRPHGGPGLATGTAGTVTSGQAAGTAGKTRTTPPQLWLSMSCSDWAADSGVSMTGPDSLYMVLGWMNSRSSSPM